MIPILAALAIGATKHFAVDAPRARRERKLAGETQRLSPWTGLSAGPVHEADLLGNLTSFGLAGKQLDDGDKVRDLNMQLVNKALSPGPATMVSGAMGPPPNLWGSGGMPSLAPPGSLAAPGAPNPWSRVGGGW